MTCGVLAPFDHVMVKGSVAPVIFISIVPPPEPAQTAGVECRKDSGVIDEIPGAYKDIDEVMAHQSDLVEVAHTLKQVVCVKG